MWPLAAGSSGFSHKTPGEGDMDGDVGAHSSHGLTRVPRWTGKGQDCEVGAWVPPLMVTSPISIGDLGF